MLQLLLAATLTLSTPQPAQTASHTLVADVAPRSGWSRINIPETKLSLLMPGKFEDGGKQSIGKEGDGLRDVHPYTYQGNGLVVTIVISHGPKETHIDDSVLKEASKGLIQGMQQNADKVEIVDQKKDVLDSTPAYRMNVRASISDQPLMNHVLLLGDNATLCVIVVSYFEGDSSSLGAAKDCYASIRYADVKG